MLNFFFSIELAPTVEDIYRQARVQKDELRNTHLLVPSTRSFVFHFASFFTLSAYRRLCIVSFFFPPRVILCDVIECQRSLLGISLAFVHCWFVFLINFSLCKKRELCFICVRRRSWEFNIIMVCSSEGKYPSGVFEFYCNLF